jgi:hypothetical protein
VSAREVQKARLISKYFLVWHGLNGHRLFERVHVDTPFGDPSDDLMVGELRGRRVAFVEDAARGLDEARTAACLTQWRDAGVRFTSTAEVVAGSG